MVRNPLEDDNGIPWTASTPLGWIVFLLACTLGTVTVLLALYLAVWMYTYRRPIPLAGFSSAVAVFIVDVTLSHWHWSAGADRLLDFMGSILFIAATYCLRYEIIRHYRKQEGWDIEINPWFTAIFSVIYINYRLNPITLIPDPKNTLISLNLPSGNDSAKINK